VPWTLGDAGYDSNNPFRDSRAQFFLPSEDEWYRAAFYDPSGSVYFDFPTGSDTAPVTTSGGTAAGTAVYRDGVNPNPLGPADITNAGGLSPFGTMGQGGNVWEWIESAADQVNDTADEFRVIRGGHWELNLPNLQSIGRSVAPPTAEGCIAGFRVAAVIPEPTGLLLLTMLCGTSAVLTRRRRGASL